MSLKGWQKQAPALSRFPIPMPVVFAIIGELCLMPGLGPIAALMMLLQFMCYLRPGEFADMGPEDLVQGLRSIDPFKNWGLIIQPQEVGHPTETGESDKSLLLGVEGYEWLSKPLQRAKKLRAGHPCLSPLPLEE